MHRSAIACLLLFSSPALAAGEVAEDSVSAGGFDFLPGSNLVPPLLAHPQEARVGVRKEIGSSRLKLDIGTSMDVVAFTTDSGGVSLAAGVDFFTYALTTSSEGLRLQVDAVDGFFGGHISLAVPTQSAVYDIRLRLLHLSAHMVDGHFDLQQQSWKDNREPLPFTRDFGELVGAVRTRPAGFPIRVYVGFSYATLVRPATIRRLAALGGGEVFSETLLPRLLDHEASVYVACHLTLAGIPTYLGTTTIESGIKFGKIYGRGVRIYASYTGGLEIFSQYYDVPTRTWGLGFSFDAW